MTAAGPSELNGPVQQPPSLSIEQRREILQREITARYLRRGFRVMSQTDTTAQLVRPKTFSFIWACAWFLLCGVGVLVYVFHYANKQDTGIYLTVDEQGRLQAANPR